jgi:ribosomal 50S subunit-recycling heat shock protein
LFTADVGAQDATDKLVLKAQVDSLSTKVKNLKAERAKAQELQQLHDDHLAKADAREKNMQSRLHGSIKALHGK